MSIQNENHYFDILATFILLGNVDIFYADISYLKTSSEYFSAIQFKFSTFAPYSY